VQLGKHASFADVSLHLLVATWQRHCISLLPERFALPQAPHWPGWFGLELAEVFGCSCAEAAVLNKGKEAAAMAA